MPNFKFDILNSSHTRVLNLNPLLKMKPPTWVHTEKFKYPT